MSNLLDLSLDQILASKNAGGRGGRGGAGRGSGRGGRGSFSRGGGSRGGRDGAPFRPSQAAHVVRVQQRSAGPTFRKQAYQAPQSYQAFEAEEPSFEYEEEEEYGGAAVTLPSAPIEEYEEEEDYGVEEAKAAPKPPISLGGKVIILNLDPEIIEEELKDLFESAVGPVKSVSIKVPKSGGDGVAEVVYRRYQDALKAVEEFNDRELNGRIIEVHVAGKPVAAAPAIVSAVKQDPQSQQPAVFAAAQSGPSPKFQVTLKAPPPSTTWPAAPVQPVYQSEPIRSTPQFSRGAPAAAAYAPRPAFQRAAAASKPSQSKQRGPTPSTADLDAQLEAYLKQ